MEEIRAKRHIQAVNSVMWERLNDANAELLQELDKMHEALEGIKEAIKKLEEDHV